MKSCIVALAALLAVGCGGGSAGKERLDHLERQLATHDKDLDDLKRPAHNLSDRHAKQSYNQTSVVGGMVCAGEAASSKQPVQSLEPLGAAPQTTPDGVFSRATRTK